MQGGHPHQVPKALTKTSAENKQVQNIVLGLESDVGLVMDTSIPSGAYLRLHVRLYYESSIRPVHVPEKQRNNFL